MLPHLQDLLIRQSTRGCTVSLLLYLPVVSSQLQARVWRGSFRLDILPVVSFASVTIFPLSAFSIPHSPPRLSFRTWIPSDCSPGQCTRSVRCRVWYPRFSRCCRFPARSTRPVRRCRCHWWYRWLHHRKTHHCH